MLYLAGIIITFFLAVLLAGKKNKTTADSILTLWLFTIGFHLLLYYLFIENKIYNYPFLLGIHLPIPLLHGPLLFLYTAAVTSLQSKRKRIRFLHFVPVIILYLFLLPFLRLPAAEKINVYKHGGAGYETLISITIIAIIVSGIVYVIASLFLLRRYRLSIENEFSNTEKINLAWLRYMVYGSAVIWIAVLIGDDTIIFGIVVLFVFLLGYFGIRQTGIFTPAGFQSINRQIKTGKEIPEEPVSPANHEFSPDESLTQNESGIHPPKIKYEKSGLNQDQAERIYKQLAAYMSSEKLFSDPELTLAALAKKLDVHPNHLSQVINSNEGKNFYDYINFHRVEEFKKLALLPGNRNYTLLSMAYECGFNSKTSFNRNFKKATGLSPTEWLQQQNISLK